MPTPCGMENPRNLASWKRGRICICEQQCATGESSQGAGRVAGQPSAWLLTASSFSRYVYIPVGGSQHGLLGTLFSTAMTFAFVSYWHGGYDYLWCWAALNWLGVTVENGVRRLVEIPCIQDSLVSRVLASVLGDS